MYYPFMRGKQFELLALRDISNSFEDHKKELIHPIIEPVKENLNSLTRALEKLSESQIESFVIINPTVGYYQKDKSSLLDYLCKSHIRDIYPAVYLTTDTSNDQIENYLNSLASFDKICLIHSGFPDSEFILNQISQSGKEFINIFFNKHSSAIYRNKFRECGKRVLIEDYFAAEEKNSDYQRQSFFTDIHLLFKDEYNLDGFGDFQTIGSRYSESGGPAYAVALHFSYIDAEGDKEIFVRHYVSDTNHTPADPASKFAEALEKFIIDYEANPGLFYETQAIVEFKNLKQDGHFPGLGYIKKLSIKHHLETLVNFLGS